MVRWAPLAPTESHVRHPLKLHQSGGRGKFAIGCSIRPSVWLSKTTGKRREEEGEEGEERRTFGATFGSHLLRLHRVIHSPPLHLLSFSTPKPFGARRRRRRRSGERGPIFRGRNYPLAQRLNADDDHLQKWSGKAIRFAPDQGAIEKLARAIRGGFGPARPEVV